MAEVVYMEDMANEKHAAGISGLQKRIRKLSASYVPQWRFREGSGDLGSGLAELFLELYQDSLAREMKVCNRFHRELLELVGMEEQPPKPSFGYMTFDLVKPDLPESLLPAETEVISQDARGEPLTFLTKEELLVSGNSAEQTAESGGSWYLRFLLPLNLPVYHLLLLPRETAGADELSLIMEYRSPNGWKPLEFSDGTKGLSQSGLLIFSGKPDHQLWRFRDQEGFWARIRAAKEKELPSIPASMYLNAAPVRSIDTGARTNLPPFSRHRLAFTAGFVSKAGNPAPFVGGCDKETTEAAAKRTAARLKHGDRAVTPKDFERLAKEASPFIQKVRCFSGYRGDGRMEPGAVTVVVLPQITRQDNPFFLETSGEIKGILQMIYGYLAERCSGSLIKCGGLSVTKPLLVWIDVKAQLTVDLAAHILQGKRLALDSLSSYLHPLGNQTGDGEWSMGNLPDHEQLKHVLRKVPHVASVGRIYVNYRIFRDGQQTEARFEQIQRFPWCLPCNGEHELLVTAVR